MRIYFFALAGGLLLHMNVRAQGPSGGAQPSGSNAVRMAATVMNTWKDGDESKEVRWAYEEGVVWKGLESCWYNTGDARYYKYIQHFMDRLVDKEGNILTYKPEDYNLDNILCGRLLLLLYKVSNQEKYYKAAQFLRRQLQEQPRTDEGSFWHKKKYTQQVWLDGLYMAQPFYAEWAATFHEDSIFNDIARQFVLIEQHARDAKTGLLYHGWDALKQERWADKATGHSPNFWARAMGWYGMALVDVLDYFPVNHPGRKQLLAILDRYAAAVAKVQDPTTGLWWDVLDKRGAAGNYPESSASCMFVYTLEKAVRMGWLPLTYRAVAKKGYAGVLEKFLIKDADGSASLKGTVAVSGLGGDPYRDGSYAYYTGEKVVVNDPKGIGAFLLAAGEMEQLPTLGLGKGRTVLLDYYFNNEHKKDITGASVRYHYVWGDQANSGFSFWGTIFRRHGLRTDSLTVAPTAERLKKAAVYIIVDPDNEKETPIPNYPSTSDIQAIYDWVRAGGVLLLMSNDSANAEFLHFNKLAEKFGIHFNLDDRNQVVGNNYEQGAFIMTGQDGIFKTTHKIYIKELSTLRLSGTARARYSAPKTGGGGDQDVIMATARVGKGMVFAVGDPWFYNEYEDGRKLPAEYENFNAANDLVKWIITEINAL